MTEVISVRFRGGCKNYDFDPKGMQVKMGDQVIVETAQGPEFGTCTQGNHDIADEAVVQPLCAVLRLATDADRRTVEYNRKKESDAFDICEKKIAAHGLEMKLVNVSASFDGSKIIFFFTADGRVDFRELVRDLASVFRARIELRQIGVRDEAKMVGGLGICGRPFCCSQFLNGFLPVFDNFERALGTETQDAVYKQGVEMIFNQFSDALKKLNVEVMELAGKEFDPNVATAVSTVDDPDLGENIVAQVLQNGYTIGGKVIRHAMVIVANP